MARRTTLLLTLVTVLAAGAPLTARGAPPAVAPHVAGSHGAHHVVQVGAVDPTDRHSLFLYEGFFPRQLRVHRGDHVRWEFPNQGHIAQAFHTVTFGDPSSAPYVRADEAPGTFAFGERAFFTSGCGRKGLPVCVISSPNQFVSSGTPLQHAAGGIGRIDPFDAVIDLPPGTYTYFCTLHHPPMQGTVEVVPDGVAVENPKPQDFAREIAALAAKAKATFAERSRPTLRVEKGRRVWIEHAGARTDTSDGSIGVTAEAFLPSTLQIRAGDTVRWVMGGTAHAVTFPDTSHGQGPPQHLLQRCELDDPAGGAPGVPGIPNAATPGVPVCPPGAKVELALTPLAAQQHRAPGDLVVSPATFHNSGIMIDGALPERMRGLPPRSGVRFPSQFEATFPVPGTYTYRCMIHWQFMGGSITVS
jgi:plastocyanin